MSSGEPKYQLHVWPEFEDALARLRKKYPRIDQDIQAALREGPKGRIDALPGFAHKVWKYRVASRDMRRGKSGGFRVILYMDPLTQVEPKPIHLLTIYAKSERADVPPDELLRLWKRFLDYLKGVR